MYFQLFFLLSVGVGACDNTLVAFIYPNAFQLHAHVHICMYMCILNLNFKKNVYPRIPCTCDWHS